MECIAIGNWQLANWVILLHVTNSGSDLFSKGVGEPKKLGSVSEGTDFGQKKNLNQRVYWFMV